MGYSSRISGRETYCIEHKCRGKGDALCHIESRSKEDWGCAIEDHLLFFQEETIEGMLRGRCLQTAPLGEAFVAAQKVYRQRHLPTGYSNEQ